MAEQTGTTRELVFCHHCENEWSRDQHGLQCPQCESQFVEVIEEGHDPRDTGAEDHEEEQPDSLLHNPLLDQNPWEREAPDPDESDIEHVAWNAGPGLRFTRTSFRSASPGLGPGGQRINDPFAPIFQTFAAMLEGAPGTQGLSTFSNGSAQPRGTSQSAGPGFAPTNPFAGHLEHRRQHYDASLPNSPLRDGQPRQGYGGRNTYTATGRLWPRDTNHPQPQALPVDQLHGLLGNLLQGMQGMHGGQGPNNGMPPFHVFAQLLNPANATHGDAVYTEEALDRVISQFMEAQNGTGAPGPASAAAIDALPKKEADKSMMGNDGKAECSVCMDNVEIGDEVTELPCNHWFHGDCVGAWLKEHDTCPHCRQGIMPKEGESTNTPRLPGQASRNSQLPLGAGAEGGRGLQFSFAPGVPQERQSRPQSSRRRSSARSSRNGGEGSSGSGSSGGLTGWVRNQFRGGGGNDRS